MTPRVANKVSKVSGWLLLLLVAIAASVLLMNTQTTEARTKRHVLRGVVGVPKAVPTVMQKCQAVGDPHYTAFNGKYYDFYGVGDYVLAASEDEDFVVHSRTGRWGSVSVNTAVGVRVNNKNTIEYNVETDKFYIDGKEIDLKVNQKLTLGGDANAHRTSATSMTVSAKNGAHLTATWYRSPSWKASMGSFGHVSLIVDAPRTVNFKVGLCVDKKYSAQSATGILHDHRARKIETPVVAPRKPTKTEVKKALKTCNKAGLKGKKHPLALRACVADQVQTGEKVGKTIAKVIKKVEKLEEKKKVKWVKQVKKAVVMKKCQAVGDPHYTAFDGKYYDFYGVGDYVLAATEDKQFVAHSRTGRWGSVSVNTAFGVRVNNDRTVEYDIETDSYYVDGKKVDVTVGQKIDLGNSAHATRVSAQSMIVTGSNGAHLTASWSRSPSWKAQLGSFGHISLIVDAPKELEFAVGLCVDKKYSAQTATGILHDHRHRTVERSVTPKKPTKDEVKKALKTCNKAGLKGVRHPLALRACVSDLVQTGDKVGKKIAKVIKKLEKLHDKKEKKWVKKIKTQKAKQVKKANKAAKKAKKLANKAKKAAKKLAKKAAKKAKKAAKKLAKKSKKSTRATRIAKRQAAKKAAKLARKARRAAKKAAQKKRRAAKKAARLAKRNARRAAKKAVKKSKRASRKPKKASRKARRIAKRRAALKKRAARRAAQKKRRAAKKAAQKKRRAAKKAARKAKKAARRAARKAKRAVLKKKRAQIRRAKKAAQKKRRAARKAKRLARRLQRKAKSLLKRAKKTATRRAIKKARKAAKAARKARRAARRLAKRACKKAKKVNKLIRKTKRAAKKAAKKVAKKTFKRVLKRNKISKKTAVAIKRAASVVVQKKTVLKIKKLLRRARALKRKYGKKFNAKKHLPKRLLQLINKLNLAGKCAKRNKSTVTTIGKSIVKQLVSVSKCRN